MFTSDEDMKILRKFVRSFQKLGPRNATTAAVGHQVTKGIFCLSSEDQHVMYCMKQITHTRMYQTTSAYRVFVEQQVEVVSMEAPSNEQFWDTFP